MQSPVTIIDIGAGLKGMYKRFLKHYPTIKIYAIEPHPNLAGKLRYSFASNSNVIVCECAISETNATIDFYCANDPTSSSILPIKYENARRWHTPPGRRWLAPDKPAKVSVRSVTLDDFIEEHKIKRLDFINIDVQGCAMNVLRSMKSPKSWDKLREINVKAHTIDFEMYQGQSHNYEVVDFLKRKYLELKSIKHISRNQEDVLTFRNQLADMRNWRFMDWNKVMLYL